MQTRPKPPAIIKTDRYYPQQVLVGIGAALDALLSLNGVRVDTASAILGLVDSRVVYMSYEVLVALRGRDKSTVHSMVHSREEYFGLMTGVEECL